MHIQVAGISPVPKIVHEFNYSLPSPLNTGSLLYLPIPRYSELSLLESSVYEIVKHTSRPYEGLVLRTHASETGFFQRGGRRASKAIETLAFRMDNRPIFNLNWRDSSFHFDVLYMSPTESTYSSFDMGNLWLAKTLASMLRQSELSAMAHQTGAILPSVSECHYVGPNGDHYSSFLRAGIIAQSIDALDSLCFWLLPLLSPQRNRRRLVLLDSWTILSLGLHLSRYLKELGFWNAEDDYRLECLRSYDEIATNLIDRIRAQSDAQGGFDEVLLIISVSSSGRLAERVASACEAEGWQVNVVSLYSSSTQGREFSEMGIHFASPDEVPQITSQARVGEMVSAYSRSTRNIYDPLCVLGPDFQRSLPEDCPSCRAGSPLIKIQPSTYLLEATAFVVPTPIKRGRAVGVREFFSRYSGYDCVSVHRNHRADGRHHLIYLDLQKLIGTDEFVVRLEDVLSGLHGQVDTILCPEHIGARSLSAEVSRRLNVPVIEADPKNLAILSATEKAALTRKRVLLVDDVVITGQRLTAYRHVLLNGGFHSAGSSLQLLVGIARPVSESSFNGISEMSDERKLHFIEKVILPNWNEAECPWCCELENIKRAGVGAAAFEPSPSLEQRYLKLSNTDDGLSHGLFLFLTSDSASQSELILGPDSIFSGKGDLPLAQVEVFMSVAHAIQMMRNEKELNEHLTTPVAKILHPALSTVERYYDRVITASMLRSTRRHDLRATATDHDLLRTVNTLLADKSSPEFRAELLFAIGRGILPRPVDRDTIDVVLEEGDPGMLTLLKSILRD